MNSSLPNLSINLLPPEKLYCNFNYWSSLFSQDMQKLWDRAHGIPLEKLPKGVSDMIFPYLLLALSDYKSSQVNKMNGIGLDNLLSLWFDKYLLNKNGYFELIKNTNNFQDKLSLYWFTIYTDLNKLRNARLFLSAYK